MQRSNLINILIVIVIALLLYNVFTTSKIKTDIKKYQTEIQSLQKNIDSAKIVNKQIDTKIDSVNTKVSTITNEIVQIDNNISIIKKKTNEKVNSIDNLSNVELEQFFTNRYNQYNTPK